MNNKKDTKNLVQTAKECLQDLLSKATSESEIISGEHLLDIAVVHNFLAKDLIFYAKDNLAENDFNDFLKELFGKTQDNSLKKKILTNLLESKTKYYWRFVIYHSDDSRTILKAAKKILENDPSDDDLGSILEKKSIDSPAYTNLRRQALETIFKRSDNGHEKNDLMNQHRLQLMVKHGYLEGEYSEINLPHQEKAAIMLLSNTATNTQDLLPILKIPTDFDATYKLRTIERLKDHNELDSKNILTIFVGAPDSTKYLLMNIIMASACIKTPEEWATILINCQKIYHDRVFEKYIASIGDGKNNLASVLKSLLKIIAEHPSELYRKHGKDLFIGFRKLIKTEDINSSDKKEIANLLGVITATDKKFKQQAEVYSDYLFLPETETVKDLLQKLLSLK